jgi:hypothetical protein
MYEGYSGGEGVCTQEVLMQGAYIFKKMGFLEDKLSDGLAKNESKRDKGQVCICRAI